MQCQVNNSGARNDMIRQTFLSLWALVASVVAACGLLGEIASADPPRFVQDRFAIGFWVDPPADANMDRHYADLAAANFTLVIGGFGAGSPEAVDRQIALCENHGLRAIVSEAGREPGQLPESSAVWGYRLRDEPPAGEFATLQKSVKKLREARPGRLAYINLFPNYASPSQLGATDYDAYVASFVATVDPDVLSMDHYPMMTPDEDGRQEYCDNLAVMRRVSQARNIPFWNYFNSMPFGPHGDPTEAQLKWQIYTSMAYGAKGVLYFCYWTPRGGEFPKGGAIITAEGVKTRHYGQAQRINLAVKNLGATLMKLTSSEVRRVEPQADPAEILKDTPIRQLTSGDYLVGVFQHADGRRAVLLNNYSFAYTAWPTVEFDVPVEKVREVCPQMGKEIAVRDDSPDMPGLQTSLDAGEGRLFLLSSE